MAFFEDLNSSLQEEIISILKNRIEQNDEHRMDAAEAGMDLEDYVYEVIDDLINRNNFDMSDASWIKFAHEVEV